MAINELEISFLQKIRALTLYFPSRSQKFPGNYFSNQKYFFFKQIGNKVWTTEIPRMFSCQLPGCTFKRREQNLKTCY